MNFKIYRRRFQPALMVIISVNGHLTHRFFRAPVLNAYEYQKRRMGWL